MNHNDILTCRTSRRDVPVRAIRRATGIALAAAFALATPALLAAPGGGKGKPGDGGGGEDPPPPVDANYTAEYIPIPSWVTGRTATNMNKNGDVVGKGVVKKGGGSFAEGYVWKNGEHHYLPPLSGDNVSEPYDLSDDGLIVVGDSGSRPGTLTAWIDFGGGSYDAIDLKAILLEAAAVLVPEWEFYDFHSGVKNPPASLLTADGRFMQVLGRSTEGNAVFPYASNFAVVVEWDWSKLLDPLGPVVAMWPLAQPPVAYPDDPDRNGYTIGGLGIELGVRFEGSDDQVLRLAGYLVPHGADGMLDWNAEWFAIVWEYDLTDESALVRILPAIPPDTSGDLLPSNVNIYGAVVGYPGYFCDPFGNPTKFELLAGATSWAGYVSGINKHEVAVGPYNGSDLAYLWTAEGGTVDLNTQVEGNLGLSRALFINDNGQILTGGSTGWYVLTPIE
ncbi:hypothetical protein BH23VER1_BH23VER1_24740 [soil metagenome]